MIFPTMQTISIFFTAFVIIIKLRIEPEKVNTRPYSWVKSGFRMPAAYSRRQKLLKVLRMIGFSGLP